MHSVNSLHIPRMTVNHLGMYPMDSEEELKPLTIFGGDAQWRSEDWTASDDRVRGGKSQSYLDCTEKVARFYGTLDIKTLGGAGFASQRTTGDDRSWDLSKYAGIQLLFAKGDKKRYTFNLKDELLPKNPETGREQSTISWEVDFELPAQTVPDDAGARSVFIPWNALNPTYRGRLKKDAKPLQTDKIKRMSFMMRSFFGTQDGDFSLSIRSIRALPSAPTAGESIQASDVDIAALEKGLAKEERSPIPHNDVRRATLGKSVILLFLVALMTIHLRGYIFG